MTEWRSDGVTEWRSDGVTDRCWPLTVAGDRTRRRRSPTWRVYSKPSSTSSSQSAASTPPPTGCLSALSGVVTTSRLRRNAQTWRCATRRRACRGRPATWHSYTTSRERCSGVQLPYRPRYGEPPREKVGITFVPLQSTAEYIWLISIFLSFCHIKAMSKMKYQIHIDQFLNDVKLC